MTDDELFADIPHPVDRPDADPAGQLEFDDEDAGPFGRGGRGPSPFAEGLNPDQLDAVVHENGPLLVVAGAGSGKTRVLTHRIAHLIHQGVPPSKILAITFTNKAAAEMRDRVGVLVGPVVRTMWVSTFHSACVRILRANGDVLGYPRQFSIYDQADTTRLTGYVIRDLGLDSKRFTPRGVHAIISNWKNELVDPPMAQARAANIFDRKHADIYAEYQLRLEKAGAMDFDDLLMKTVVLFREHGEVLEHYRQRFEHILVDEYQDTNQAQNEMILMLAGGHQNVCVVGDTDQCLPPGTMVSTPSGPVAIESIAIGDVVVGAAGGSTAHPGPWCTFTRVGTTVTWSSITAAGRTISATPHHLVPARLVPQTRHVARLPDVPRRPRLAHRPHDRRAAARGWQGAARAVRPLQPGARRCGLDPEDVQHDGRGGVLRIVLRGRVRATDRVLSLDRTQSRDGRRVAAAPVPVDRHGDSGEAADGGSTPSCRVPASPPAERRSPIDDQRHDVLRSAQSMSGTTACSGRRTAPMSWSGSNVAACRSGPSKHRSVRYETSWKDYRRALADAKRVAAIGGLDVRRRLAQTARSTT